MNAEKGIPEPITRYWIKCWENGRSTPQFKPDTGEEIAWGTQNTGLTGLLFVPFTPGLAAKVQSLGNFAIPSRLSIVDIPVLPSETVKVRRMKALTEGTCYRCNHCQHHFDWHKPTPPDPVCPKCGAKNHWYCEDHGEIADPIFFKREEGNGRTVTEVRCPACPDPRGLLRSNDLEIVPRPVEFKVRYHVWIDGNEVANFDETSIKVLRSCQNQITTSTS